MDSSIPPNGGDRDRGTVILGVTWTLTVIALTFVCLRMYNASEIDTENMVG